MTTTNRRGTATRRSISLAPNVLDDSPTPPTEPDPQLAPEQVDTGTTPARRKPRARKAAAASGSDTAPDKPRARRASPAATAEADPPATSRARTPRKTRALAEPQMVTPTLRAGEETFAEEVTKITVNLPVSLYKRLSGVVMNAQLYGQPEGVHSLTDVVLQAVTRSVGEYEAKWHGGEPFPAPQFLTRGRRRRVVQPTPTAD